jgi:phytoene dehydrogenase-like protein
MLRPEIVADLGLAERGLRMVPCEPGLQAVFEDGTVVPWWTDHDRAVEEFASSISARDAESFDRVHRRLHALARYLQPFFLEEPPNLYATGWSKLREGRRLFRRFRHLSGDQLSDLVRFATGSLGEFVERHFESDEVRRLYLANNVYGMHAPPYRPGTAIGLLFHMLSGGEHHIQGFNGHVIGGMGSITRAMEAAVREVGAKIRTSAPVARVDVRDGRVAGVTLEDGTEIPVTVPKQATCKTCSGTGARPACLSFMSSVSSGASSSPEPYGGQWNPKIVRSGGAVTSETTSSIRFPSSGSSSSRNVSQGVRFAQPVDASW